ncbi:MAG TPA: Na+/H+ antiporter NhaC family protein [Xenococcaceae cyanobacterium]
MAILFVLLIQRGFKPKTLCNLAITSSKQSFSVISILLLIGVVIAIWMTAGTVPAIVYYGIQIINPSYFILSAFILTILVSLLLGTSFGTVSTIGLALMIMAKESNVNPDIIAGAIIAGAYFGDRCSPMSSSANLIAIITQTKIHLNIKKMLATTWLALLVAVVFYLILSLANPVQLQQQFLLTEISKVFKISPLVLLPALAILLLAWLRVEIKLAMLVSILISLGISIYFQGYNLSEIFRYLVTGFKLSEASSLQNIILGGGIISMAKVSLVVVVSTAFAGIFRETKVLKFIQIYLKKTQTKSDLFLGTIAIAIAAAAFGCTQTIAIILTKDLVKANYQQQQLDNYQLAVDLENTVVVLSPLIPWNIAGFIPATILMTDSGFIPFAFYLYVLPLVSYFDCKIRESLS